MLLAVSIGLALSAPGTARGATGDLDSSFGDGGLVTTSLGKRSEELARTLVATPDGGAVIVGSRERFHNRNGIFALKLEADGTPDEDFGREGRLVPEFFPGADENAVTAAVQPDGKILIAGSVYVPGYPGSTDLMVIRLLPDGSLDQSFGSDGIAVVGAYEGSYEWANEIALAPDGSIVVAGGVAQELLVVRLTSQGKVDTSLSGDGFIYGRSGGSDVYDTLAVGPDGGITLGGWDRFNADWLLKRYDSYGEPDTSFSGDGLLRLAPASLPASSDLGDLLALPDGGLLIASGAGYDAHRPQQLVVAQLDSSGVLDGEFGTGGYAYASASKYTHGSTLARDADGRITVAGWIANDTGREGTIIVRFSASGEADQSFGRDGVAGLPFKAPFGWGPFVALDSSGEVWVASQVEAGRADSDEVYYETGVGRLTPGGEPDEAFAGDGFDTFAAAPRSNALMYDLLLRPGGDSAIGIGTAFLTARDGYDATLVKYAGDGSIDRTFGSEGVVSFDIHGDHDRAYAAAAMEDGGFAVVGETVVAYKGGEEVTDAFVARFDAGGQLQTGFGNEGVVTLDLGTDEDRGASVQADARGRIVVSAQTPGRFTAFRLAGSSGALDPTFGGTGIVNHDFDLVPPSDPSYDDDESRAVVIAEDGSVLIGGQADEGDENPDLAVIKLLDDGRLAEDFGENGVVTAGTGFTEYSSDLALTPGGKILMLGYIGRSAVFTQFGEDGMPDTTFGEGGVLEAAGDLPADMQVLEDGHVTTAGTDLPPSSGLLLTSTMLVTHHDETGAKDPGFGDNGYLRLPPPGPANATVVAVRPDGRTLIGGTFDRHFALRQIGGDAAPYLVTPGPPPPGDPEDPPDDTGGPGDPPDDPDDPPDEGHEPDVDPDPQTRFTAGPTGRITNRQPAFRFNSTINGATFQCKVDRRPWRTCRSPRRLTRLPLGPHLFSVRAVAQTGRADPSPAQRRFRVVRR